MMCMGDGNGACPQVLEHSKSSYLAAFVNLRNLIQHEAVAAEDNVRFLLVLEEPCKVLAAATPEAIPKTLPRILHCVRLIWNLSRFYSMPDRITGLLRKVQCLSTALSTFAHVTACVRAGCSSGKDLLSISQCTACVTRCLRQWWCTVLKPL
jgi:hypothetical protein